MLSENNAAEIFIMARLKALETVCDNIFSELGIDNFTEQLRELYNLEEQKLINQSEREKKKDSGA